MSSAGHQGAVSWEGVVICGQLTQFFRRRGISYFDVNPS